MKRFYITFLILSFFYLTTNAQEEDGHFTFKSSDTTFKLGKNTESSGTITISPGVNEDNLTTIEKEIEYTIEANKEYTITGNFLKLEITKNKLTSIKFNNLPILIELRIYDNTLTDLDVSNLSSLMYLDCNRNNIKTINVAGLKYLTKLNCALNEILTLNLEGLEQVNFIHCSNNQITSIDISSLKTLQELHCYGNTIESLDFTNSPLMRVINCRSSNIKELKIAGLEKLFKVNCRSNNIKSLDFSGCKELQEVSCYENSFTVCGLDSIFLSLPTKEAYEDRYFRIFITNKTLNNDINNKCRTNIAQAKNWRVMDYNDFSPITDINNTEYACPLTEQKPINAIIEGTKTLEGKNLIADQFEFVLYDEASSTELAKSKNDINGKFAITIPDLNLGTYNYSLKETNDAQKNYVYDTREYSIKVTITPDITNELKAHIKIMEDETSIDEIKFINKYDATFINNISDESKINIYPNPIRNNLKIESNEIISEISILDINGKVILEEAINSSEVNLETSYISRGIYVLRIETASGLDHYKITKE